MSYLVDALKKAERERHQQRGADMQALSASDQDAATGSAGRILRGVVIALVVCNLGLLVYLVVPGSRGASGQAVPAPKAASLDDAAAAPQPESQPQPVQRPADTVQRDGVQRAQAPARRRDERGRGGRRGLPVSDDPTPSPGRVTYAQGPVDDGLSLPRSTRENAPTMQELGGSVPAVAINGHLYSSVPGRSFILVSGRRYHQGERLAAGPAVESIDAKGATLNYRGQRYHVNGPG